MEEKLRTLYNVLINTRENKLVPASILFDSNIIDVKRISGQEFEWKDVNTAEKKEKIINSFRNSVSSIGPNDIDGGFNLLIPGAIDPHVHFDTPGYEFRDTFEHASTAAAYGGVTTIIDMPCTSVPPVTSFSNFHEKLNNVNSRSLVDFAFWGGVCGNDFEDKMKVEKDIIDLSEAGVVGYKVYVISGMDTFRDLSYSQIKDAAEFICKTGKPLGVHAEDKVLVESRRQKFKSNNLNTWEYYCKSRDTEAEKTAVSEMIKISDETKSRIHIVHLSSKAALNLIKKAQIEGTEITAETCPHYLHFTQDDFNNDLIRNSLKTAPPVKEKDDRKALWKGLEDGSVSFVTTDHAGCNPHDEKISDNFWDVYGGIPGIEHRVPYLLSEGFMKNRLTLERTVELLCSKPAEYFNIPGKGEIIKEFDADFSLINLWKDEVIKADNMHSKGKYTPFEGMIFNCKVEKTILRGKIIMDIKGNVDKTIGYGKFLRVNQ